MFNTILNLIIKQIIIHDQNLILTCPTAPVQAVVFSSNLPQVELQLTHDGAALLLLRNELMISQS